MMGLSRAMDTARARSAAFQGRVGRREAHVLHVPPQCVDTDAKLSREQCQRLGGSRWQPMEGVRAAIGGPASLELLRARQRSVAAAGLHLAALFPKPSQAQRALQIVDTVAMAAESAAELCLSGALNDDTGELEQVDLGIRGATAPAALAARLCCCDPSSRLQCYKEFKVVSSSTSV